MNSAFNHDSLRSKNSFHRLMIMRVVKLVLIRSAWVISFFSILVFSDIPCAYANPAAEKTIPVINIVSLQGDTILLADIVGDKPVFLFFWATWCKVCSKDMNRVYELQNELAGKVDFWGIAWKDTPEAIKSYFAKKKLNINSYIDSDGSVFDKLNIKQTPTVAILNTKKEIIYLGYGSFRKFSKLLQKEINRKE